MLKRIVILLQLHKNTICKEMEADYGAICSQKIEAILGLNGCCCGLLRAFDTF